MFKHLIDKVKTYYSYLLHWKLFVRIIVGQVHIKILEVYFTCKDKYSKILK